MSSAISWYGFILVFIGGASRGQTRSRSRRKIAPSKAAVYRVLGHSHYVQRDYTNAVAMYRQADRLGVQSGSASLSWARPPERWAITPKPSIVSERDEIIPGLMRPTRRNLRDFTFSPCFRSERNGAGIWQKQWKRTAGKTDGDFYWKAVIQCQLGDTPAALAWLTKSYENRERDGFESVLTYLILMNSEAGCVTTHGSNNCWTKSA